MTDNNTENLDIKSLDGKGALWTLAGTGIALAANSLFGGGNGLGGLFGGNGAGCNGGMNSAMAAELALTKAKLASQEDICAAKQTLQEAFYALDKRVTMNEAKTDQALGILGQITKVVIPASAVCPSTTSTAVSA